MKKKVVFVAALLVLMLGTVSQAVSVVNTSVGNGADTFVGNDSKCSSTSTHGSATQLESRYNGGGSRFRCTFLRFDISGVTEDFTDSVLMFDATYIKSSTGRQLDVYGLVDEDLDSWVESTTNYQTAPGMLQPASGWDTGDYLLDDTKLEHLGFLMTPGTGGGTPTYPIRFWSNTTDLGTAFSDFLESDENGLVTLVLINETGTSSVNCEDRIASKEYGGYVPPTLVTPEPATMLLLGVGGLLAIRRKRG